MDNMDKDPLLEFMPRCFNSRFVRYFVSSLQNYSERLLNQLQIVTKWKLSTIS